jgi:hypothetical protein
MSNDKANKKMEPALTEVIRKELSTDTNRRFLKRLKAFRPDPELPNHLVDLLGALERTERTR